MIEKPKQSQLHYPGGSQNFDIYLIESLHLTHSKND
jgi:hypothetical protein